MDFWPVFQVSPFKLSARMCCSWKLSINSKLSSHAQNVGLLAFLTRPQHQRAILLFWPVRIELEIGDIPGITARGWDQVMNAWEGEWGRCPGCGAVAAAGPCTGTRCHSGPWGRGLSTPPCPAPRRAGQRLPLDWGMDPAQGVIHAGRPLLIILTRQNDIKDLY